MIQSAQSRLDALEAHTNAMSEGILKNNKVIKDKFEQISTRIDAHADQLDAHADQLGETHLMSEAMQSNNLTLQDKFSQIQTNLDAHSNRLNSHAKQLDDHETGLHNHHKDLGQLAFDMRSSKRQLASAAPQQQERLNINELNALARNF